MIRLVTLVVCVLVCLPVQADTFKIAGQVKQPDGSVAKEATVRLLHLRLPIDEQPQAITDSEGRFEFANVTASYLTYLGLHIVSSDGQSCGVVRSEAWSANAGQVSLNVQLEESWNFYVKVVDEAGVPIGSAVAAVHLLGSSVLVSKTDANGRAEFTLPRSHQIIAVAALKENLGLDFHTYQRTQVRNAGPSKPPLRFPIETAEMLTLREARQVEVQVKDAQGQPIVDARVSPGVFVSGREPIGYTPPSNMAGQNTNADGKVVFNWVPKAFKQLFFSVHAAPEFVYEFESRMLDKGPVDFKLERTAKIRGRVTDNNGHGKAGVRIKANGATTKNEFNADAVTDSEGKYELAIKPNAVYIVGVVDETLTAPVQEGIVVPRGKDIESIDFRLQSPMVLTGRMLDVVTLKPVPDQEVRLVTTGRAATAEEAGLLDDAAGVLRKRMPYLSNKTKTDANGRYTFFTLPGNYSIQYMDQDQSAMVGGEPSVTLDLPAKIKKLDSFTGKVIDKANGSAIAGASVYETNHGATWQVTSDEQGAFSVPRALEGTFIVAYTSGYSVAGIAHVPAGQRDVVVECQPTCTVSGKLETADGRPIANRQLECRLQVQVPEPPFVLSMSQRVETNAQGEFTLKRLIAERECFLLMDEKPGVQKELARFKPEVNNQLSLGTLKT